MSQYIDVDLNRLSKEGKNYKWEKPKGCPCCGNFLWGHGHTGRYFIGYTDRLWLKKYRCPSCKAVITMMPLGFIKYYQTSLSQIFIAILSRLKSYKWPPWPSRQVGGHWLRRLKSYCMAKFGLTPEGLDLLKKASELSESSTNFLVT